MAEPHDADRRREAAETFETEMHRPTGMGVPGTFPDEKDAARRVRSHEPAEMRDDLETTIRRHPLTAIGVAFMAGYFVRRIF